MLSIQAAPGIIAWSMRLLIYKNSCRIISKLLAAKHVSMGIFAPLATRKTRYSACGITPPQAKAMWLIFSPPANMNLYICLFPRMNYCIGARNTTESTTAIIPIMSGLTISGMMATAASRRFAVGDARNSPANSNSAARKPACRKGLNL